MNSVLIRVSPEIKKLLDDLKEGKTVSGSGYYRKQMRYDDVIKILLTYRADASKLKVVTKMLQSYLLLRDPDFRDVVVGFTDYVKSIRPYLDQRCMRDIKLCDDLIVFLDNALVDHI